MFAKTSEYSPIEQTSSSRRKRTIYCGGSILIVVVISLSLFLLLGVPFIVVGADMRDQVRRVESTTRSQIVQIETKFRNGIALTEDGHVCILEPKREVNCLDFDRGVGVRYIEGKEYNYDDFDSECSHYSEYLILSDDGIIYIIRSDGYRLTDDGMVIGLDLVNIARMWTPEELGRSTPIKYYQPAAILGNAVLIAVEKPIMIQYVVQQ